MRSSFVFNALLATVTIGSTAVSGLGINCRGSSDCGFFQFKTLINLVQTIEKGLDDNAWVNNGQQIAVENVGDIHFAAFLQNSGGAPGHSVKTLIRELFDHGCNGCGSIPLFFPKDNDVKNGELTVNSVSYNCRGENGYDGMCPPFK